MYLAVDRGLAGTGSQLVDVVGRVEPGDDDCDADAWLGGGVDVVSSNCHRCSTAESQHHHHRQHHQQLSIYHDALHSNNSRLTLSNLVHTRRSFSDYNVNKISFNDSELVDQNYDTLGLSII